MKREYTKPELIISEYIIEETIAATASTLNLPFQNNTDTTVTWDEFVG